MLTLLLRLEGSIQSWGTRSRFDDRDTGLEPSKSGVIGLICAALGRPRSASVDDLAALKMGVRVDRAGIVAYDFQTAQKVVRASGSGTEDATSRRYYLSDAAFLVGFEGEEGLLREVHGALLNPFWPISLGRKSYLPSRPVYLPDGLRPESLAEALAAYLPLMAGKPPKTVRYVLEAADGAMRQDQPGGPFSERLFVNRYVQTVQAPWGEVPHVSV